MVAAASTVMLFATLGASSAYAQEFLRADTLTQTQTEDAFDDLLDTIMGDSKSEPPKSSTDDALDDFLDEFDEAKEKAGTEDEEPAAQERTPEEKDAAEDSDTKEDDDGKIGEAPEDNSELFLRTATVLLAPGEMQFDHGFSYTVDTVTSPFFREDGTLSTERLRNRQLLVPLGLRFGISDRLQGNVDLPFGWSHVERANTDIDEVSDTFGLGDISVGISKLLKQEKDAGYDLIGSLSVSAPTGDSPFGVAANDPALGLGFWTLGASFTAVKSYDPVVFFGSFGYTHTFEDEYFGVDIQLGESFNYGLGMGMAVSDDVTLSASLSGLYQTETRINDIRQTRTSIEPISLRLGVTGLMFQCHIVEPFVRFGMTDDASDTNFGIVVTRL